jgi:hypothetical protein
MEEQTIEQPMNMNYREAVAWQLGYGKGFIAGVKDTEDKFKDIIDKIENKRQLFEYGFKRETQIKDFIIELKKELSGEKP